MSSANNVQRDASILPRVYGQKMLATPLDRVVGLAQHVWEAVVRTHQRARREAVWTPLRGGLGIVGMLSPLVILTGFGTDLHDLSWFIYYGWSSTDVPLGQAASDAPAWLAWVVVAALALRWRRAAGVAAWLAIAGMIVALTAGAMLPTAQTGGWMLLALLAALGLTFSPGSFRGLTDVGMRRVLTVLGAVGFVLFARLLGHQFAAVYVIAWIVLGAAVVYASGPRTLAGRWALLLLSVPAMSAIITMVAVDTFSFNIYRPSEPWPVVIFAFYGVPVVVLVTLAGLLRHYERLPGTSRAR